MVERAKKICFKCGVEKYLADFYKHSRMADGHLNKCKECTKKDTAENRIKNEEYYRVYEKNRMNMPHRIAARKEYQKNNRDKARKYNKKWSDNNKESVRANVMNRRARKRGADGSYCAKDIREKMSAHKGKCAMCKTGIKKNFHVDHIIPLAIGGTNWPSNLQLLCANCNWEKGAKHPIDFAQERGLLL